MDATALEHLRKVIVLIFIDRDWDSQMINLNKLCFCLNFTRGKFRLNCSAIEFAQK